MSRARQGRVARLSGNLLGVLRAFVADESQIADTQSLHQRAFCECGALWSALVRAGLGFNRPSKPTGF